MMGEVLYDGQQSDPLCILSGVKHGCLLVPVFFNLIFAQVLQHSKMGMNRGI